MAIAVSSAVIAQPAAQPVFNDPADVAAIKAAEEILATEIDIDKVMPLYADNATVLDLFAPGVFRGKAEIRAGFGPQLGAIKSMIKTTPEMTVATNGTFGCAVSQVAYQTVMKDGRSFAMNVRNLDAYKKIDGQWRVVQQHVSFPVDPATLVAQTSAPIQPRTLTWSAQPLAPVSVTPESLRPTRGRQAVIAEAATGSAGQQMHARPLHSRSGEASLRQRSVSVLQSAFCWQR